LVAGTDAAAVVTVKIFVEQHEIAEVRIVGVARVGAEHRPAVFPVGGERRAAAPGNLGGGLAEIDPPVRACGGFDEQGVARGGVVALQCLDEEVVEGERDGPAPVGISAEEGGVALRGQVVEPEFTTGDRR
jgi:hypothetical protein